MKTRLVLAHGTTFKLFRVTGANQGLSKLTHVTKDLRKWQISSNSDPNIAKVQHSFFKNGDMESSKRQSTSLSLWNQLKGNRLVILFQQLQRIRNVYEQVITTKPAIFPLYRFGFLIVGWLQ